MRESAFGCGQLAAVMRWRGVIEEPAKGKAVIGKHGEQGAQVLTEWLCACVHNSACETGSVCTKGLGDGVVSAHSHLVSPLL